MKIRQCHILCIPYKLNTWPCYCHALLFKPNIFKKMFMPRIPKYDDSPHGTLLKCKGRYIFSCIIKWFILWERNLLIFFLPCIRVLLCLNFKRKIKPYFWQNNKVNVINLMMLTSVLGLCFCVSCNLVWFAMFSVQFYVFSSCFLCLLVAMVFNLPSHVTPVSS